MADQSWLIQFKQTLAPRSLENEDSSEYMAGTAVVKADNMSSALDKLHVAIDDKRESILDIWKLERHPFRKDINTHIMESDEYSMDNLDRHVQQILAQDRQVAFVNMMSSAVLVEEGFYDE